ncbi:MAG: glucokinase [Arenicella sp.]
MSLCIVADIGGTNARFAVENQGKLTHIQVYSCRDFADFSELLDAYFLEIKGLDVTKAAIAVASHVSHDTVEFTNLPWKLVISKVSKAYGFEEFKVLNDFAALAVAVPLLGGDQLIQIGGGESNPNAAKALIGAGTGLGVSGLLPHDNVWVPIQGQGGHITIGPTNSLENKLFEYILRENGHVSAECVLSGKGLVSLYKAMAAVHGIPIREFTPADIVSNGLADEPTCSNVLKTFCEILGSTAGDLALTLGARGGVYIGGGIVTHMKDYFHSTPFFRQRFEHKGCMAEYIEKIPAYLISETRAGLLGALESTNPDYKDIGITYST